MGGSTDSHAGHRHRDVVSHRATPLGTPSSDTDWEPRAANHFDVIAGRIAGALFGGAIIMVLLRITPSGGVLGMRPVWFVGVVAMVVAMTVWNAHSPSRSQGIDTVKMSVWGFIGTALGTMLGHLGPDARALGLGALTGFFLWVSLWPYAPRDA